MLTAIILARLLVPEDYGLTTISLTQVCLSQVLTEVGVQEVLNQTSPSEDSMATGWRIELIRGIARSLMVFVALALGFTVLRRAQSCQGCPVLSIPAGVGRANEHRGHQSHDGVGLWSVFRARGKRCPQEAGSWGDIGTHVPKRMDSRVRALGFSLASWVCILRGRALEAQPSVFMPSYEGSGHFWQEGPTRHGSLVLRNGVRHLPCPTILTSIRQ